MGWIVFVCVVAAVGYYWWLIRSAAPETRYDGVENLY